MNTRVPNTRWSTTLERMQRGGNAAALPENEAFKTLNDLFRRTVAADNYEKTTPGAATRRCSRPVSDAPKGRCNLALLTKERDYCTFHANPGHFAATGVGNDEVYAQSRLMREHLAP